MSKPIALALVASLAAATAASAQAPSPIGMWSSPTKHGVVEVYACGDALCGRVENGDDMRANPDIRDIHNKDAALQSRRLKGLTIMTGLRGGPAEWTGGSVYDPQSGNTYHGSVKLVNADTLDLKGCIVAPFCRTQTWTRIH